MKLLIYSLWIVLLVGLNLVSCETENTENSEIIVTGQLIANSPCKSTLKSGSEIYETVDSLSCVEYAFDVPNKVLMINHINAGFNCCAGTLSCIVEFQNDTLSINEMEESAMCHCNCLYDLEIVVNGLTAQKYTVCFNEPYVGEQDKLVFELDLATKTQGLFCVTRFGYPWGIESVND